MFNIFKRRKSREERLSKYQKKKRAKYSLRWKRYFDTLKKRFFRKREPEQSPLYPYEELFINS
jgi:hypothetical protein